MTMTRTESRHPVARRGNPGATAQRQCGPGAAGWLAMMVLHAVALALGACGTRENPGRVASASAASIHRSATGDVALPAIANRGTAWLPPGAGEDDWRMPSRDYAGTRYSPLAEITPENVAQLD